VRGDSVICVLEDPQIRDQLSGGLVDAEAIGLVRAHQGS
jgi:hypothetical protein